MDHYNSNKKPDIFAGTIDLKEKVLFALAEIGEGTSDEVSRKLEALEPEAPEKLIIASVHKILSELHDEGAITTSEKEGDLIYKMKQS